MDYRTERNMLTVGIRRPSWLGKIEGESKRTGWKSETAWVNKKSLGSVCNPVRTVKVTGRWRLLYSKVYKKEVRVDYCLTTQYARGSLNSGEPGSGWSGGRSGQWWEWVVGVSSWAIWDWTGLDWTQWMDHGWSWIPKRVVPLFNTCVYTV